MLKTHLHNYPHPDDAVDYTSDLTFLLRDYCLGMTYTPSEIKLTSETNNIDFISTNEPLSMIKRARSPESSFQFMKYTYTQYRKTDSDPYLHDGCGNLVYSH